MSWERGIDCLSEDQKGDQEMKERLASGTMHVVDLGK